MICLMFQTSTNAYQMEDWGLVAKFVPTPLDHSAAAVTLDIHCLGTPAMVRTIWAKIHYIDDR